MGIPEADLNQVAVSLGGKPTCSFPARPYHRDITSIIVTNGVTGPVNVYRGLIGSLPVAQSPLGNNNTFTGKISLPAGQQLFIQWTNAASPVSLATARVASERDDNPLGVSGAFGSWQESQAISLALGNPPAQIVLGQDIPAELIAFYAAWYGGGSFTVNAVIIMNTDANNYFWIADLTRTLGAPAWARGVTSTGAVVHEIELIYGSGIANFFLGFHEGLAFSFGRSGTAQSSFSFANTQLTISADTAFDVDGPLFGGLGGMTRGLKTHVVQSASLAPVVAESVQMATANIIWKNGRTYAIKVKGQILPSAANSAAFIGIRRGNTIAGTLYLLTGLECNFTTVAPHFEFEVKVVNASGGDITDSVCWTLSRAAGAGTVQSIANGTQLNTIEVWDITSSNMWPVADAIQF